MRLNTRHGKTDHFTAKVGQEGSKLNPGRRGVIVALTPDDDPWQGSYIWVSPTKARAMADLLIRQADKAESQTQKVELPTSD